jgi:hypothetical protein
MRHVIHAALLAATCCGVAAGQNKPTAPRPLPAGKEARLWRHVEQELIAFEAGQLLADYRSRCGTRQPDAEFERLLAKSGFMRLPSPRHMEAVVNRAAHRGPIDPLMYWYAAEASDDLEPGKAWYKQAIDELQRVDAAPLVRLVVRTRARERLGNDADPELLAGMAADMVACAGDPRMAGIGQRLLILMFLELWPGPDPAQRPLIDRMLAAKATDRYAALTIDGMCQIREAWAARSSKAASQVTEAGWKGFKEHLEAAAESLTAAHRLHPEFPEAPTKMIDVCGGSGAIREIRGWLDAAVAAQFDYTDAYRSALHFYSVRWGGSRKLQLDLGQECARTERFDTLVPQMLRNAIGMLANDTGKDLRDSFTEPLQRQLDAMHLRRIEHLTEVGAAQWELSQRAVELIMFRRTREGVELSQSIIGGLNWEAAETFGGVPKFVRRMIADHPVERTVEARLPVEMFAGHEAADYPGLTVSRSLPVATTRPLQRDVDEQWSNLYAGLVQAQYRAHTEDPEPLRERAAAALTQFSQLLRGAEGAPSPTELNRTVSALAADGAADPLLAYCRGRCLEFDADLDAAVVAYEAARTGFVRQGHAALFPYLVLRRLASIASGRGDNARAEQLRVEASGQLRLAARMPEWRGDGRRHFASLAWTPECIPAYRGEMTSEDIRLLAADEAVDPWLRNLLEGIDCCHRAMKRKPDYFDGAKDHFALIERANELLRRAHAMHPTAPHAATAMIAVCHVHPQKEPGRHWFDEAVAAQFDFTQAYFNLAVQLSSMAGGSNAALMHFATECLESNRFDTVVPSQFLNAIGIACTANPGFDRWVWSAPSVQRGLDRLAAGHSDQPHMVRYYEELRMVADWAGGRYDSARARWRNLGRPATAPNGAALGYDDRAVIDEIAFLQQKAEQAEAAARSTGK